MVNMDIDKRKRNKMIQVIFVDIIMALTVVALVFVLVAIVEGWRLSSNLKLEQNGMAQIESLPTGAKVIIDGRQDFNETNISKLLSAGEHEVVLKKDGYDSWSKKINIMSGILTRLKNPRLFKQERLTEMVSEYTSLRAVYAAPDHRSLLVSTDETTRWQYITALGSDRVNIEEVDFKGIFTNTSDGKFTGKVLQLIWNETSEKVLMQVESGGKIEWGMINLRKVSESINLSQAILKYLDKNEKKVLMDANEKKKLTGTEKNLEQVVIEDAVANKFLAIIDGNLQEIDVVARTLSEAYLKNIAKFKVAGSEVIYLTRAEKDKKQIGIYKIGDKAGIEIETVVRSKIDAPVQLAISEFDGKKYMGMVVGDQFTVYRTKEYPLYGDKENMPERINEERLDFVPERFEKSANGELFVATAGMDLMVYDLDLEETNRFQHKNAGLNYLDNYMMFDVIDGKMEAFDFDGSNRRTILDKNLAAGFDAVINSNNRYLYYVVRTESGFKLLRDKLV